MLLGIVFGAVFLTVFGSLSLFVLSENRLQTHIEASTEAFSLAEAGLEYYKWFLAHNPGDVENGTGEPGPYVISFNDPEGGAAGVATLTISDNTACGQSTAIDIESEGASDTNPSVTRTLTARYAQPSIGIYSYVLNDSVWAGDDRIILGPYHSNGGIRMDGTANSSVTSSLETWNCTDSYGCNPTQSSAPGVTGNGPNQDLWSWPVPQVDFNGIAADFGTLKATAQAEGIYYPRYSTTNGQGEPAYWRGYHLIFNANRTVTVRRVSSTIQSSITPVNPADGNTDRILINNENNYETRTIPTDCGLIFVEDNVWIEGEISGKVTLVAANVVNANISPNVYVRNNVQYVTGGGTDGLTVLAEHNVLIAPDAPNSMTMHGIFIAQDGAFGMNAYSCGSGNATKTGTLTILGTTVSNKRTGTKWSSSCGAYNKGYQTRVDSYDNNLAYDPPPFTPTISDDYTFIRWREE